MFSSGYFQRKIVFNLWILVEVRTLHGEEKAMRGGFTMLG